MMWCHFRKRRCALHSCYHRVTLSVAETFFTIKMSFSSETEDARSCIIWQLLRCGHQFVYGWTEIAPFSVIILEWNKIKGLNKKPRCLLTIRGIRSMMKYGWVYRWWLMGWWWGGTTAFLNVEDEGRKNHWGGKRSSKGLSAVVSTEWVAFKVTTLTHSAKIVEQAGVQGALAQPNS